MSTRVLYAGLVLLLLAACAGQTGKKPSDPREASRINAQLGIDYLRKGDIELARDKLEKAVAQDASNAEAHGALGLLYANTGDLRKAERHYERSLGLRPDDPNVLNNYGTMLCAQARYERAEILFRRAANSTRYGTPEVALTNAGVCARKQQDEARAEQYFREALRRNPGFADALGQMALLSSDQARYLNARGFLQRYESLQGPMTREVLLLGVRIELALGDRDAAQRYAKMLQTEYPSGAYDVGPDIGGRLEREPVTPDTLQRQSSP